MISDSSRMLPEKRSIASRSGPSSITISTKSPPLGAGPTTRITSSSRLRRSCRTRRRWRDRRHVAHVDVVMRHRRHVGQREQPALVAHLHRHGPGADAVEHAAGQRVGHHAARRRVQHQRRGVRGGEPVVEPVQPEVRDRRHIDQHFRDHHEQDREHEEPARQPRCAPAFAARRAAWPWLLRLRRSLDRSPVSAEAPQQAQNAPHPGTRRNAA